MTVNWRRVALSVAAPLIAIAFALLVTALVLVSTGDPVWSNAKAVWDYGTTPRVIALTLNQGTVYYLSALAVAIGFRMNLFNIGVDGQYRLAAFAAAIVGSHLHLWKPLDILLIVLVAMFVGGAWAGIAAALKATRGVSEVISTIMLNAIAGSLVAYLLRKNAVEVAGSNNITTKSIPENGAFPGIPLIHDSTLDVYGFIVIAILAGIAYSVILGRTRFGFDLRATGRSMTAAVASGVNVRRMLVISLVASGAVAGLVGMPQLLGGDTRAYSLDFPAGLGFTGIAIALLGRNNAVGMALAALLFAFLDSSSIILDINGVAKEIVLIMQGTLVLSVVIVYEVVRRYGVVAEQRRVSRLLADEPPGSPAAEHTGGGDRVSLVGTPPPATEPEAELSRWNWHLPRTGWPFMLLALAGFIVLMSVVRVITGADDLTSSGTIASALALSVPIGMAGLGGLWSERSGVVNIGLEGMMILGTWGAGWAGYQWGAWTGVLVGVAMGAVGGLVHAVATVTFGVDHIVSGVAINLLGLGVTQFLSVIAFQGVRGGGQSQSPPTARIQEVSIPGLSDPLLTLQNKHWFLVSDVAGIARGLLTGVSLLTVVAVLLLFVTYFVLWRTPFGLRLRSCGESPTAAESLGVNVYLMKYWAVIASGAFAGLGGAFLAIVAGTGYREGQTGGRGYIGLAAMIFGNWRPGGLAAGAALFGYTDSLQLRSGDSSVHALLLLVGVPLVGYAVWMAYRRHFVTAIFAVVIGAAALAWYFSTDVVPGDFTQMAPYVTTLLVLAFASQRLRPPAADGLPYRRGQGG